eukprot:gene8358-9258_t
MVVKSLHKKSLPCEELATEALVFLLLDDKKIEWKFLKFLHDRQENQRFKLANTFSSGHLDYKKNKMKVSLAVRALSSSVQQEIVQQKDSSSHLVLYMIDNTDKSEFRENILYYILGSIVSKLVKNILCENCKECLIGTIIKSDHGYSWGYNEVSGPAAFTAFVNNGGLAIPSESIFKVLQCCKKLFWEHVCKEKYAEITKMKNIRKRMMLSVVSHSWGERRQLPLFQNHLPGLNEILFEEEHERWLTKCVADISR